MLIFFSPVYISFCAQPPNEDRGLLILEVSRSHITSHHSP